MRLGLTVGLWVVFWLLVVAVVRAIVAGRRNAREYAAWVREADKWTEAWTHSEEHRRCTEMWTHFYAALAHRRDDDYNDYPTLETRARAQANTFVEAQKAAFVARTGLVEPPEAP